jgi:hypothetical protein
MMHEQGSAISLIQFVRFRTEGAMDRVDLLEAASRKLAEAVLLLVKAGERHLATSAGELAEIVEFRASAASPLG